MQIQSKDMKQPSQKISIIPPTTHKELRSYFKKGKDAIFVNLPHPKVYVFEDHAYCRPIECVEDFLAHGYDPNTKKADYCVQSLLQSHHGKYLHEKSISCNGTFVSASLWMDDFEPNYSKKSRLCMDMSSDFGVQYQ